MNKITKTEFKNILTNNRTTLFAIFNNSIVIDEVMESIIKSHTAEILCIPSRKAEIKGKYIVFDNDSRLDINDNNFNTYNIYKYETVIGTVLASECEWYDSCDKRTYFKTIYYFVN